jgi:hypothetical protein
MGGKSEWGLCQVPIIRPNVGRRELPLDTARRRGVCQSGEGSESKGTQKAVPEATVSAADNILVDLQQLFNTWLWQGLYVQRGALGYCYLSYLVATRTFFLP